MKAFLILFLLAWSVHCVAADLTSQDAYKQFTARNDYEGGVTAFTREIAAHPADVRLLIGLGLLHFSSAKYTEAKTVLERASALDPTNTAVHNLLAVVLSNQGHPAEAIKHLDLAIEANPDYADAYFNRAVILATNQPSDKPAARESYTRAISLGCEPDKELEKLIK
jgi:Flp pilus assembly protein TadD